MKATDARYTLQDSSEVMAFLERLVCWGGTPANGWHAARQCLGWKLGAPVSAAGACLHSVALGPVSSPGECSARCRSGRVQRRDHLPRRSHAVCSLLTCPAHEHHERAKICFSPAIDLKRLRVS